MENLIDLAIAITPTVAVAILIGWISRPRLSYAKSHAMRRELKPGIVPPENW